MINIITIDYSKTDGPAKVVKNLIKGLDKIGYQYLINKEINAVNNVYIPNRISALYYLKKAKSKIIVGPNLFIMPKEIPKQIDLKRVLYILPSEWNKNLWKLVGFERCPIHVWATGIDTDDFMPKKNFSKKMVRIYHKKRSSKELEYIVSVLKKNTLKFEIIRYGAYSESEYKEKLWNTLFLIWHGIHESQGIALQEALAANVPVLVCDANSVLEAKDSNYKWDELAKYFPVTSAPYFDESCGIKVKDLTKMGESIDYMFKNLSNFSPREYILNNLSLEGQARKFIELYGYLISEFNFTSEKKESYNPYKDPFITYLYKGKRKLNSVMARIT